MNNFPPQLNVQTPEGYSQERDYPFTQPSPELTQELPVVLS